MAEKTEEPTEKRRRDARRKGEVAFSAELPAVASLAAAVMVLGDGAWRLSAAFGGLFRAVIAMIPQLEGHGLGEVGRAPARLAMRAWLYATLPVLLAVSGAGVALAVAQVGFKASPSRLRPSLARLSPGRQLRRWLSPVGGLELLQNLLKLVLVLVVAGSAFEQAASSLLALPNLDVRACVAVLGQLARSFLGPVVVVFALVASFDYLVQRRRLRKSLRMTKDEVKREHREQEGDPLVKGQRRALHQELALQRMLQEVPKADALVVNPAHLAVALRYERDRLAAPRVTAKGGGAVATRLLALARRHEIPLIRDVPLAHALFAVELGRFVPRELYETVAEVLLFASRLRQAGADGPGPGA